MSWARDCGSKPGGMRRTRPFVRTSSNVVGSGLGERTSGTKAGIAAADFGGDAGPNLGGRGHTTRKLYGGDRREWLAHDPCTLLAAGDYRGMRGRFEVGRGDHGPRHAAERLSAASREAGIDATLVERKGGHSYAFWRDAFVNSAEWIFDSVGIGQFVESR